LRLKDFIISLDLHGCINYHSMIKLLHFHSLVESQDYQRINKQIRRLQLLLYQQEFCCVKVSDLINQIYL
jgi:hypothetical protein